MTPQHGPWGQDLPSAQLGHLGAPLERWQELGWKVAWAHQSSGAAALLCMAGGVEVRGKPPAYVSVSGGWKDSAKTGSLPRRSSWPSVSFEMCWPVACHCIKVVSKQHDIKKALVWMERMYKKKRQWGPSLSGFGQDAQSSADQNFTRDITGVNIYSLVYAGFCEPHRNLHINFMINLHCQVFMATITWTI